MAQKDKDEKVGEDYHVNLHIEPLEGLGDSKLTYTPTHSSDDDGAVPPPLTRLPNQSRRDRLVATVRSRVLRHPEHNVRRNLGATLIPH